jgi:spore germination cell wall hydrolase CwlJ-like protein
MCGGSESSGGNGSPGASGGDSYVDRLTRTIEANLARNNAGPVSGGGSLYGDRAPAFRSEAASGGGGYPTNGGPDRDRSTGGGSGMGRGGEDVGRPIGGGSGMGGGGEDVGRSIGGGGISMLPGGIPSNVYDPNERNYLRSIPAPMPTSGSTGMGAGSGTPFKREITDIDKDYMARTIIGEAAGEPIEGWNAVGNSILNRFLAGTYGKSIKDITQSENQYSPWNTEEGTQKLLNISTDSPQYKKAMDVVNEVMSGKNDITGGAVNFANVDTVLGPYSEASEKTKARVIEESARDDAVKIGRHTFTSPVGSEETKPVQSSFIDGLIDSGKKLFTGNSTDNRSFGDKALDYGINTAVGVASPPLGLASLVSSIFGGPTPASLLRKGLTSASSAAQKEFNRDKQMTSDEVDLASRSTYGPYGNLTRDQYREQYGNGGGGGADRPKKKKAATEPVAPVAAPAAIPTIVPQSTTTPVAPGTTPNTRKLSDEEYAALSPLEKAYYDMGISTYGTFTPEYNYFPNRQPILLREPVIAPDEKNKKRNGGLVKGPGTETSDSVPALIGGKTPAALSDGEFVFTGRAVRGMGNGDRMEGARKLHQMMKKAEGNASKGGPRK